MIGMSHRFQTLGRNIDPHSQPSISNLLKARVIGRAISAAESKTKIVVFVSTCLASISVRCWDHGVCTTQREKQLNTIHLNHVVTAKWKLIVNNQHCFLCHCVICVRFFSKKLNLKYTTCRLWTKETNFDPATILWLFNLKNASYSLVLDFNVFALGPICLEVMNGFFLRAKPWNSKLTMLNLQSALYVSNCDRRHEIKIKCRCT